MGAQEVQGLFPQLDSEGQTESCSLSSAPECPGLGSPRWCQPPLPLWAKSRSPSLLPLFGFGIWAAGETPELVGLGHRVAA